MILQFGIEILILSLILNELNIPLSSILRDISFKRNLNSASAFDCVVFFSSLTNKRLGVSDREKKMDSNQLLLPTVVQTETVNGFNPITSFLWCFSLRLGIFVVSLLYLGEASIMSWICLTTGQSNQNSTKTSTVSDSEHPFTWAEIASLIWYLFIIFIVFIFCYHLAIEFLAAIRGFSAFRSHRAIPACHSAFTLSKTMRTTRACFWSGLAAVITAESRPTSTWITITVVVTLSAILAILIQIYFSLIFLSYRRQLETRWSCYRSQTNELVG